MTRKLAPKQTFQSIEPLKPKSLIKTRQGTVFFWVDLLTELHICSVDISIAHIVMRLMEPTLGLMLPHSLNLLYSPGRTRYWRPL